MFGNLQRQSIRARTERVPQVRPDRMRRCGGARMRRGQSLPEAQGTRVNVGEGGLGQLRSRAKKGGEGSDSGS